MDEQSIMILGGGASGLAAAIEASRTLREAGRAVPVTIVEKLPRVGKKLLATGNGRCNLTNSGACAADYFADPAFVGPALDRFGSRETLRFFRSIGLLCREEAEGRVYPLSNQAASVLDALRLEAQRLGVRFLCDTPAASLDWINGGFSVNGTLRASHVIVACGGMASPVHGSDGGGYRLLRALGHPIVAPFPSLVPLQSPEPCFRSLKGIRVQGAATLLLDGTPVETQAGELQFTDTGLSGIAVMQLSRRAAAYWAAGGKKAEMALDLAPSISREALVDFLIRQHSERPEVAAEHLPAGIVPKRLGGVLLKRAGCGQPAAPCGSLSHALLRRLAALLKNWRTPVSGTRGFSQAQVTGGGADTRAFFAGTMESRKAEGLYACGEVLDVDGGCGGYNLQWAWSSGRLAGRSCAVSCLEKGRG